MKTIGLLGGTSWVSTVEYYRTINRKIGAFLWGNHSAKIILRSVDYEEIKKYDYQDWEKISEILVRELQALDRCDPDCILTCNNTLHKAYELVIDRINLKAPVLHIVDCSVERAGEFGWKKVLLLGTKFTMEDGFYAKRLERFGLEVIVPSESERLEIQRIATQELAKEIVRDESRRWCIDLIGRYACDAVVVGCTELPLLIRQEDCPTPVIDTLERHCESAVRFALS